VFPSTFSDEGSPFPPAPWMYFETMPVCSRNPVLMPGPGRFFSLALRRFCGLVSPAGVELSLWWLLLVLLEGRWRLGFSLIGESVGASCVFTEHLQVHSVRSLKVLLDLMRARILSYFARMLRPEFGSPGRYDLFMFSVSATSLIVYGTLQVLNCVFFFFHLYVVPSFPFLFFSRVVVMRFTSGWFFGMPGSALFLVFTRIPSCLMSPMKMLWFIWSRTPLAIQFQLVLRC